MIDVLNLFRAGDIAAAIQSLSIDQKDLLMKYLYAGLAKPELYNPGVILTWHEKASCKRGRGKVGFLTQYPLFSTVDGSRWNWLHRPCHVRQTHRILDV